MRASITKHLVDGLKAGCGVTYVWDTRIPGFGLYVLPSGRKVFAYQYGPRTKRRRIKIDTYGRVTLEQARKRAMHYGGLVAQGIDPLAQKHTRAKMRTFGEWTTEYLAGVRIRKKRPREDVRYLRIAGTSLGKKRLDEISVDDIRRLFESIVQGGHRTDANRWLASVRACLQMAWREDRVAENPAMKVKPVPENPPRDRTLSATELRGLLDFLAQIPDPYVKTAFQILLETGARSSEVLRARWADIDFEERTWRIPSPKAGRPQTIPLPTSTLGALSSLPRRGEWVIPGRNPGRPRHDLKRWWDGARKYIGTVDLRIHDLRRSLGLDIAKRAGILMASRILRHSDIRVTQRHYAPLGMADMRKALEEQSRAMQETRT